MTTDLTFLGFPVRLDPEQPRYAIDLVNPNGQCIRISLGLANELTVDERLAAAEARAVQAEMENAKLVLIADLVNHFHNGIRDVEAETVLGRIADVLGPPLEGAASHPAIGKSSLATPELGSATLNASSSTVGPVHRVPNMGQDTYSK